jgi:hypothetical protein
VLQNLPGSRGVRYKAYFDFVVSVDGVAGAAVLGLLEELLPLLDLSLEPDVLGEAALGDDDPEELDELGELGLVAAPLLLEESLLELEPDIEPDGEDGEVPEVPLEDFDAPGLLALSQP